MQKQGKSEYLFSVDAVFKARATLSKMMSKEDEIASVTDDGIDAIVNGYMHGGEFNCSIPVGHYKGEEGSEHYLFYAMEKKYQCSFHTCQPVSFT